LSSSENTDYRIEINNLRTKLGLAKEKDRAMTIKISQLEEDFAAQSRYVHAMKLTKRDQQNEKQTTGECLQIDKDKSVILRDVEKDVHSAYLIEMKKRENRISSLEGSVRCLEDNLSVAESELKRINVSEIASQIESLKDERDTLLEFIQVNLNSPIYICMLNEMLMMLELHRWILRKVLRNVLS
jgi:hypothetical protein